MIKTVHRWYWAWDYEKEENWLNEMSANGYALTQVGFCKYVFTESKQGEYSYRLEYLNNSPTSKKGAEFIEFLGDTGVEYVGCISGWTYFRKKAAPGDFQLFSDIDSKISYLSSLLKVFLVLFLINCFISGLNLFAYLLHGMNVSFISSAATLLAGLLLLYAYVRLRQKVCFLQRERVLRE